MVLLGAAFFALRLVAACPFAMGPYRLLPTNINIAADRVL